MRCHSRGDGQALAGCGDDVFGVLSTTTRLARCHRTPSAWKSIERPDEGIVRDLIDELSRRKKQTIAVIADSVMLPVMLWAAFALRLGEWTPDVAGFWSAFVVVVCVAVPVFGRLGLYRVGGQGQVDRP